MSDQLRWRTSTFSVPNKDCVEVAYSSAGNGIRDTKNRAAGALHVEQVSFNDFIAAVKAGTTLRQRLTL